MLDIKESLMGDFISYIYSLHIIVNIYNIYIA